MSNSTQLSVRTQFRPIRAKRGINGRTKPIPGIPKRQRATPKSEIFPHPKRTQPEHRHLISEAPRRMRNEPTNPNAVQHETNQRSEPQVIDLRVQLRLEYETNQQTQMQCNTKRTKDPNPRSSISESSSGLNMKRTRAPYPAGHRSPRPAARMAKRTQRDLRSRRFLADVILKVLASKPRVAETRR